MIQTLRSPVAAPRKYKKCDAPHVVIFDYKCGHVGSLSNVEDLSMLQSDESEADQRML